MDSERRYRRLLESVTDYLFHVRIADGQAVATEHGPNCAKVTGYAPEDFTENPLLWIAMVPEEDRDLVTRQVNALMAGDKPSPVEHRIHRKDGQVRWVQSTLVAHRDGLGRLLAYDGLLRDITHQKRAETELRGLNEALEQRVAERTERMSLLANAISHLNEGVLITSDHLDWPGPHIVFVNEAMCRISGYRADELLGATPRMLQGDLTDRETLARIKSTLAAAESCQCDLVNYRKDGTPYHAEIFITPLLNDVGRRTHFVSIHVDITARKQMEQTIAESEQRLKAILDTAVDAIINIDRTGKIIAANPAVERMFGYTVDELVGQNVSLLMPSPYREEHDDYIARYFETRQPRIIGLGRELLAQHKDGKVFPIDLAVSEVDHLEVFTGIIRDISHRKALEQEIIDISTLEQQRIGHDIHDGLGQHLTGISLTAKSLENKLAAKSMPEAEVARQMTSAIRCALEEADRLSKGLAPVEISPQGLAHALHELGSGIPPSTGIHCQVDVYGVPPLQTAGAATHLYRIAQEAVNNAVKHAHAKHIEVSLRADLDRLLLTVCDDGHGMQRRADPTTGLGLHIMRYRAGILGGRIDVQSTPNGGTTVQCTIPRKAQRTPE